MRHAMTDDEAAVMNEAPDVKLLHAATKSWGRRRIYDSIADTIGHTPRVCIMHAR